MQFYKEMQLLTQMTSTLVSTVWKWDQCFKQNKILHHSRWCQNLNVLQQPTLAVHYIDHNNDKCSRSSTSRLCLGDKPTHQRNLNPKQRSNGVKQPPLQGNWKVDWKRRKGEDRTEKIHPALINMLQRVTVTQNKWRDRWNCSNVPQIHQRQKCWITTVQANSSI